MWSLLGLSLGLVGAAHAGTVAGVLGGVAVPLGAETASAVTPEAGLLVGYRIKAPVVHLQPELQVKYNVDASLLTAPVGASLTFGGPVGVGAYAHVVAPINGYLLPGVDGGLAVELSVPKLTASLRAGYQWVHPVHYKCGNCAQPADHWATAAATATYRF